MSGSIDFYACEQGAETLTHTAVDDAVDAWLDALDLEHWPDVLTVHAFARQEISEQERHDCAEHLVHTLLEHFEEYFDPNSVSTPKHAVEAARVFVDAVLAKQPVWSCEVVPTAAVEVEVAAWVSEHAAHWVKESDVATWMAARKAEAIHG